MCALICSALSLYVKSKLTRPQSNFKRRLFRYLKQSLWKSPFVFKAKEAHELIIHPVKHRKIVYDCLPFIKLGTGSNTPNAEMLTGDYHQAEHIPMVSILGVDRQLFVVQSLLWVIPVNWLLAIRRSVECLSVTVISRCATILSVQNAEYATRKSTSRFWLVQLRLRKKAAHLLPV